MEKDSINVRLQVKVFNCLLIFTCIVLCISCSQEYKISADDKECPPDSLITAFKLNEPIPYPKAMEIYLDEENGWGGYMFRYPLFKTLQQYGEIARNGILILQPISE